MICTRCIIDGTVPQVFFDTGGVCNYCKIHDKMDKLYPVDKRILMDVVDKIKETKLDQDGYDVVVGVSGGCDSSYLLYYLKEELNLDVVAVHVDNGWNTSIAKNNMNKMTKQLGVPLEIIKLDKKVFNSLCRSFLYASVPDADIVNDLALLECLYQYAMDNGIFYVVNGHSFRTEGTSPLGFTYMDGGYVEDVNRVFENVDITGFPHLSWSKQKMFWDYGIRSIRPMYHLYYNKPLVIRFLINNFRWEWYKGLHMENIYTKFVGNYLWVNKFKIDYRKIEYSALVRSNLMSRSEALDGIKKSRVFENKYLVEVLDGLGLDYSDLRYIMQLPIRSYNDYGNYLDRFRSLDNLDMFKRLLKEDKIPYTFYKKYVLGV